MSAGVPTVWLMLLDHLQTLKSADGAADGLLPHLERLVIGGSAAPPSMVAEFEEIYGVACRLSWGMTELSPCGVVGSLKRSMKGWADDATLPYRLKPGRAMFGLDMKVVAATTTEAGDEGTEGAGGIDKSGGDGDAPGRLLVKGPYTIQRYWNQEADAVDSDGWFDTVKELMGDRGESAVCCTILFSFPPHHKKH